MTTVEVVQGDITKFPSDVIVNAANSSLLGGGGVDGAIHKAAGPDLLFACRLLGGAKTGEAKITDAYGITTAQKIIHTVGPVYKGLDPEIAADFLYSCYQNSLTLAKGFKSVTFPAISTGIYGYPLVDATEVAVNAIKEWLEENPDSSLEKIYLIAWAEEDFKVITEVVNAT